MCRYDRILKMIGEGWDSREIAKLFKTDLATIHVYELAYRGENSVFSQLHPQGIPYTAQEIQYMIALYEQDKSVQRVANRLNTTHETVRRILKKSGVTLGGKVKTYSPEEDKQMADLYRSGLSARQVGELMGMTENAVYHHLRHLGALGKRKVAANDTE